MIVQRQGKRDHLGTRGFQARSPERLRDAGARYTVRRRQDPRLIDQIGKSQLAPTYPFALGTGHHHELIVEQDIGADILIELQAKDRADGEV